MSKKKYTGLERYRLYRWRYSLAYISVTLVAGFVLYIGLDTFLYGIHASEVDYALSVSSLSELFKSPLNPLIGLLNITLIELFGLSAEILRYSSVVFGLLGLISFYSLLHQLYWDRLAIVGTFLLATSSWFLLSARIGTDQISTFFISTLALSLGIKAARSGSKIWYGLAALSIGLGLYSPLFVYLLLGTVISQYKIFLKMFKKLKRSTLLVAGSVLLLSLLPLLIRLVTEPAIARTLLNIPATLPSLSEYIGNINKAFSFIFWRSFDAPGLHLAKLPMLDIFTSAMVALGIYQFEKGWPSKRSKLMFITFPILLLAAGLQLTDAALVILLAIVYIFAAIGTSTLLRQWYSIFPKNPVARTLGIIPTSLLLLTVSFYHLNRYFIAFSYAPETKSAYQQQFDRLRHDDSAGNPNNKIAVVGDMDLKTQVQLLNQSQAASFSYVDASDLGNVDRSSYNIIFVDNDVRVGSRLSKMLPKPTIITSDSIEDPVLFMRFDLTQ